MKHSLAKVAVIVAIAVGLQGCLAAGASGGKSGSMPIATEKVSQLQVGKTTFSQAVQIMGLPISVDSCCGTAWIAKWEHASSGGVRVSVPGVGGSGGTSVSNHLELFFNPTTKILTRIEQYQTQFSSGGVGI